MVVHPTNEKKHREAERQRILLTQQKMARDNEALIFALREVHRILADKSSSLTDEQRVSCAKAHVILALGRYGTVPATRTTN